MADAVDLFTEIGKAPDSTEGIRHSAHDDHNMLFMNNIILFNNCAGTEITLSDGHLGVLRKAYPQSYPQILWVSIFRCCSNNLRPYAKALSSIDRQTPEPT